MKTSSKAEKSSTINDSLNSDRDETDRANPNRLQVHTTSHHRSNCKLQSSQPVSRQTNQTSQLHSAKSRMNVVSMLALNVMLFAIFTFPFHFSRLYIYSTSPRGTMNLFGSELFGFLVVSNSIAFRCLDSALNPLVIIILSPRIRSAIRRLFCRRCIREPRENREQMRRGRPIQMQEPTRTGTTSRFPNSTYQNQEKSARSRDPSQGSFTFGQSTSSVAKSTV